MKLKGLKKRCLAAAIAYLMATSGFADLQDLIDADAFNTLETEAAIAALITYNRLLTDSGCRDSLIVDPGPGEGNCTGQVFTLFANVREIIHTANEVTNDGPTAFSLGSDIEGLGFTLRWTAAEEYAAQGNMSGEFVGGQVSGLATRLTALRAGASGFNVLGLGSAWQENNGRALSSIYGYQGMGASGDANYSRWGGFINYDFGDGSRDPTALEDAFDFENSQITLGVDYRASDRWILGVIVGLSEQKVDFDGSQSIVEGSMDAEGTSIQPFFMFQQGAWYMSASMGWQQMSFDTERAIRYPSFNPDINSADTVAVSDTDADMISLFVEAGYSFRWRKFSLEPYVNVKHSDISIDGFVEDDINDDAFDVVVEGQDITSQEFTFGTKLQYTLTPSFGVFIPYVSFEFVNQADDAPRVIEAYYAQDPTGDSAFTVPTEELDSSYNVYTLGMSAVLRGARQSKAGGTLGGDVQGFVNYRTLQGLDGFDINFYSLGLRYTF